MFKKLEQMKIKKRLITAFIIVVLVASFSGLLSAVLMKVIDGSYSSALVNYGFSQGDIGSLLVCAGNANLDVHDKISYTNDTNQQAAAEDYEVQVKKVEEYFVAVESTLKGEEETGYYKEALSLWDDYQQKAVELMKEADTSDTAVIQSVQDKMAADLDPIYDSMYNAMADLMNLNVDTGNSLSGQLTLLVWILITIVVVIVIFAIIFSLNFAIRISKNIAEPIAECSERLVKLSKGDLSSPVPTVNTQDEARDLADATNIIVTGLSAIIRDEEYLLGEMSNGNFNIKTGAANYYIGDFAPILESIRTINTSLSNTLHEISESSQQVSLAANQMAEGASTLAEGATDQASSIEELLATVTEVTNQVENNAKDAASASSQAKEVGTQADSSMQQMGEMTDAMNRISDTSKQIAAIINTIDAIATQTNLLSLNASIEAARAGEAGKGFAVVANEIGELASQSSQAANNTRDLIEASIREVENGSTIANKTADSLQSVAEGITTIVGVAENVKESSEHQASAMEQINGGITQISQVVQNNSATAEESSATSEELSAQATNLNQLLERFILNAQ